MFNNDGTAVATPHMVEGNATTNSSPGTVGVTLTGSAAFTSSTSYSCTVTASANNVTGSVTITSGSAFTISGAVNSEYYYICVGN